MEKCLFAGKRCLHVDSIKSNSADVCKQTNRRTETNFTSKLQTDCVNLKMSAKRIPLEINTKQHSVTSASTPRSAISKLMNTATNIFRLRYLCYSNTGHLSNADTPKV